MCCLVFTSCYKESDYTVTYHTSDPSGTVANVTLFEYDASFDFVTARELKIIEPNVIYPITSSDLARYVVIGVESTIMGHITEWYCADIFELDHNTPIHIDVDFITMNTQTTNPVDPSDGINRYLHK